MSDKDKKREGEKPSGSTPDPKNQRIGSIINVPEVDNQRLGAVPSFPSGSSSSQPKMEKIFEKQNEIVSALQEQNAKMFNHFTEQHKMVFEIRNAAGKFQKSLGGTA